MTHTKAAVYAATREQYDDHRKVTSLSPEWRARRLNLEMQLALFAPDLVTRNTWVIQSVSREIQFAEQPHIDQALVLKVLAIYAELQAAKARAS